MAIMETFITAQRGKAETRLESTRLLLRTEQSKRSIALGSRSDSYPAACSGIAIAICTKNRRRANEIKVQAKILKIAIRAGKAEMAPYVQSITSARRFPKGGHD